MTRKHREEFVEWLEDLRLAVRASDVNPVEAVTIQDPNGRWYFAFSAEVPPGDLALLGFSSGSSVDAGVLAERIATGLMAAAGTSAAIAVTK